MYCYAICGVEIDGSYCAAALRFCSRSARATYLSIRPHFFAVSAREAQKFARQHALTISTVR